MDGPSLLESIFFSKKGELAMILKPGDQAPDFELQWISGDAEGENPDEVSELRTLRSLVEDGPALLAFVKEGCPTCEYSLPLLDRIRENYPKSGVSIVAIAQESMFTALKMAKDWEIRMPILLDQNPYAVSEEYGIHFVPTFLYVGQDRRIRDIVESFAREELKAINEKIGRLSGLDPIPFFSDQEDVPPFRPG
jgi:thiol-disulfide isomerase/thioredoxin